MAMADGTAPDLELGEDNPPSKPPDSDGRTAAASMELFRPGDPDHLTLKPPALVLYASFRLYAPALGLGGESILFGALSRSQIFYPSIATFACAVLNRVLWYCALAIFVTVSASLILKRHRYPESFWWEVRHPARHNLLFTPLMAVTFLLAGLPDELRVDSLNTQATIAEPTPTHWTVALWVAWGTTLVAHIAMCIWTYSRWLGSDEEFSGHTLTGRILPDTSASAHWTTPDPGFPRGYELQLTHLFTMVVWHLLSISASSLSLPASYSLPTFHVGLLYLVYLTVALFQNGGRMLTCPEVPEGFKTAQRSFLVLLMAPWAAAGSAYVAAVGTEVGEGGGMPQLAQFLLWNSLFFFLLIGIRWGPRLAREQVHLGWWAYTFPTAAVTSLLSTYLTYPPSKTTTATAPTASSVSVVSRIIIACMTLFTLVLTLRVSVWTVAALFGGSHSHSHSLRDSELEEWVVRTWNANAGKGKDGREAVRRVVQEWGGGGGGGGGHA